MITQEATRASEIRISQTLGKLNRKSVTKVTWKEENDSIQEIIRKEDIEHIFIEINNFTLERKHFL